MSAVAAYKSGDYQTAFKLFFPLASNGEASAQNNVGNMYGKGLGVPKNDTEAANWYRKAAELGHTLAQYNLGNMLKTGLGVEKDELEAVAWYRKAADSGLPPAQYDLAVMYDSVKGVFGDDAEAAKWYRKAADQGFAMAQNNLGVMCVVGRGVSTNQAEALRWFRKAAEGGDMAAHQNLLVFAASNGELTESECLAFERALNRGEQFTHEDLDRLRLINFGNPNFRKPSVQKLDLLKTPRHDLHRDTMWGIKNATQYATSSSSLKRRLITAITMVVWYGLPTFGIFLISRWLWS